MTAPTGSTVSVRIDNGGGQPPAAFDNIPWFPGLTILQAMIVGQAMYPGAFSFRVNYHSAYGAYFESIDDGAEGNGRFWFVRLDDKPEDYGASEAIIIENPTGANSVINWTLQ